MGSTTNSGIARACPLDRDIMKHIKTLNLILGIVAVLLVAFITVMVITFWKFQAIPDTLVTCVLGTGTAELIATAVIEIVKKKYEGESNDNIQNDEPNI